jgi:8-oxo-dGTP pyrophosphatase MutT (NUDIX family)
VKTAEAKSVPRVIDAVRLQCVLEPAHWEFPARYAADIEKHWREKTKSNPALYDGRVLLARRVEQIAAEDGGRAFSIGFFETRFSNFLAWRDFGFPDETVFNCFAMAALRSADGGYLLGEMSALHSSPGAIYFPAGTPDRLDVREDGSVDLEGSAARELLEETGLSAADARLEPGWTVVFERQYIACLKTMASAESSKALLARARAHLEREDEPELAAVHMASRREDLSHPRLASFVRAFLEARVG